ncbi:hypothetical protein DMN91_012609 [Ooceraea biroi]|uniref:Uncharacterized protein n=1 Tax=Ooceraea biroi TaxID=2015173 RepID=A0A026VSL3_OOCBI|nr:uncharacterized protein LOC105287197 [Ooceraea biroi]XP_011351007.1 uncharacterized protein LOC105287197 [Ooceraea biroi]XP_011351008.1 uncharacterized protein LOC105287197 [Ooceraea biroi]EZA46707.1 hypothetical protein X777_02638 [Ooceraea biroi]RLU14722.1 hypothetical protein DMN91_012609 [Ooceraea biroi]
MALFNDIKKATSLNWMDNNAHVLRLQGLSQAEKDRKMNDRKVKKPRNIHLVEPETCDNTIDDIMIDEIKHNFDRHEISAAIKEVNGGVDLSNKHWEEVWSKRLQEKILSEKEVKLKFPGHNDAKAPENHSKDKELSHRSIKNIDLLNKLHRNAAIMSLVKMKKISLEDIIGPSSIYLVETENQLDSLYQDQTSTAASNNVVDNARYQVESVPHRDDPDIFVHPLLQRDKEQFKGIDFTLPRLGKKVVVKPPEFFLAENDDKYFDFVKKKKNTP